MVVGAIASNRARTLSFFFTGRYVLSNGQLEQWLKTPPLLPFGHPLLHSEWRTGMERGGARRTWTEFDLDSVSLRALEFAGEEIVHHQRCLLYTSPSPRDS